MESITKPYVIVKFVRGGLKEVVPRKWLYETDKKKRLYCFWPNINDGGKISTMVEKMEKNGGN